jgi:hypothetical protein
MKPKLLRIACGLILAGMPAATWAEDAPAPIVTKSGRIEAPPAGKGQVVFFRPGTIIGAALGCTVHEGDRQVARLGAGKYYVITAEPGVHRYATRGQAADTLNLEVEADETYFVKCKIGSGVVSGAAQLEPSDRASFAKKAKGATAWTPPADWLAKQGS